MSSTIKPDPTITVPGEVAAPPQKPRMERLASRLSTLANVFTGIALLSIGVGLIEIFESAGRDGLMLVLASAVSIIPFWIVYGFAWALADSKGATL